MNFISGSVNLSREFKRWRLHPPSHTHMRCVQCACCSIKRRVCSAMPLCHHFQAPPWLSSLNVFAPSDAHFFACSLIKISYQCDDKFYFRNLHPPQWAEHIANFLRTPPLAWLNHCRCPNLLQYIFVYYKYWKVRKNFWNRGLQC